MQNPAALLFPLLCALASIACHRKAAALASERRAAAPLHIATAVAVAGPTPDVLALTGTLAADQRAEVTADTQGKVLAVLVQRGQRVRRGEPVVRLDVSAAAIRTAESSAQLDTARASQRLAESECQRSRTLHEMGAISGAEAERQQAQCAAAGAEVNAARARVAASGKSVGDGLVRAPFDGVVVERSVTAGEWVAPGRSLFTLIDADPLLLHLAVPESYVDAIRIGQQIELSTVSRPNARYRATITRITPEIGASRALTVEATVDAAPELVPGMYVEARVLLGHTLRPVLPASAVVQRGTSWHAFVVYEGIVEERVVQLGPAPAPGLVSIVQSVAPGERVVHTITDQIVDGLRVF